MIEFDGVLDLAVGMSAGSKIWKNKKYKWSNLVKKLEEEHKTTETYKEFMSSSKEEQSKIKDVGGYVGGYLRNGRRKVENVVHRQLLTLDIDFAHKFLWDDFVLMFNNAACIHSTHKHCDAAPRLRLIIPLNRECAPDEYVAVSRKIAGIIGIDFFDRTTFETHRLMFWPSNSKDAEYYFRCQDGPWLNVDKTLAQYIDWRDSSLWPTAGREADEVKRFIKKQEDPEDKKGIIGAFCRTYPITDAIETFLSDIYVKSNLENRYTYINGSTSSGLVVYEDKFAYSHHGTDPCGGKLCNSFDLVRIHKFGHLDEDLHGNKKLKSFSNMESLAIEDKAVKNTIAAENIQNAKYDFSEALEQREENTDWMQELEIDKQGNYLSTSTNLNLIFTNDAILKGTFKKNDFDKNIHVFNSLPWHKITESRCMKNIDISGIRNYVESVYGIMGALKIEDALKLNAEKKKYHPVREYLNNLKWDGKERISKVLPTYFGSRDNVYTQEALKKTMVGAVARVHEPGIKFDLVLVLVSQIQGTGKSSFFRALGKKWFSDSLYTVKGNKAFEAVQGSWIIELAELTVLKNFDAASMKHFITKQDDKFRPAYERIAETFARQCIFVASIDESLFLKDTSGNRRFIPIDVANTKLIENKKLFDFIYNEEEIDQLWAEAVYLYKNGESLCLSREAEKIADREQTDHAEADERAGLIETYLNTPTPENWDSLGLFERRLYLEDNKIKKTGHIKNFTCTAEIWCECLGKPLDSMDRYKTRELNNIIKNLDEWDFFNTTRNFSIYGKQKCYVRK
jgi:predicted P-loop ATPase